MQVQYFTSRVFVLCLLTGLAFFTANCSEDRKELPDFMEEPEVDTLRYLALGDSYTIGESVPVVDRYPVQLVARLREAGLLIEEPLIIARTGWTTARLLQELNEVQPDSVFDLVTLLIGVNNQYQGRSISEYELELRQLIDRAITYASGDRSRVVIISIPDYAFTPFGQSNGNPNAISSEIDSFNAIKQSVTAEYGLEFVNITDISRQGLEMPVLVAGDGLHPSGKMYELWVERLEPLVKALLDK